MKAVDTHAHLDFSEFDTDRERIIAELEAAETGVINPATDLDSNSRIEKLTRRHPLIWGALGLHPTEVAAETLTTLPALLGQFQDAFERNAKLIAIGEIGLDYHHQAHTATHQKAVLRQFLSFALEHSLPVIFHCREAYGDLVTVLGDYPGLRGVIHCFNGTTAQAGQFLELGLHLSFTAQVTYPKNELMRSIVTTVPKEKILLETDAPFLAPQESRGTRNEPKNILKVAVVIADAQQVAVETLLEQTTANARQLFRLEG